MIKNNLSATLGFSLGGLISGFRSLIDQGIRNKPIVCFFRRIIETMIITKKAAKQVLQMKKEGTG
ncbi:hypothetical protein [Peribacillus kribbensis]|uniref:hypothetical protein n=1 Tax=Peribacillus kribbensis TaxID=356658 RepID=UPI00047A1DC9|nr:hypothetical protein [Peribacillus kribbensis]